jgi:hypothetical protein
MIFVSALALPLQYEDTYGSSSLFKLDKPFLTEKRAFISLVIVVLIVKMAMFVL